MSGIDLMADAGLAVFTGFGDDPDTSIKFGILSERERQPEWTSAPAKMSVFEILNSDDIVEQLHGRGVRTLEVRLWFPDRDALESLDGVVGTQATLRYQWDITTLKAGGTKETRAGNNYLVLPDTTLVSLDIDSRPVGGYPEATATFRRPYGEGSYYGFAVYSEESS